MLRPITPGQSAVLAVTASTGQRAVIPKGVSADLTLMYKAPATNTALVYITTGGTVAAQAVVATTSFASDCYPIYPGEVGTITIPAYAAYISWISATGTQELAITVSPDGI